MRVENRRQASWRSAPYQKLPIEVKDFLDPFAPPDTRRSLSFTLAHGGLGGSLVLWLPLSVCWRLGPGHSSPAPQKAAFLPNFSKRFRAKDLLQADEVWGASRHPRERGHLLKAFRVLVEEKLVPFTVFRVYRKARERENRRVSISAVVASPQVGVCVSESLANWWCPPSRSRCAE